MEEPIEIIIKNENSNTTREIKDKINQNKDKDEIIKSDFEKHIIEVYKIISGYYSKINEEKNRNIKLCEIEMRKALDICQKEENIILNKNILDKISRIINHQKINILLILSKIFIILMQKNNLFDKKADLNIII